MHAGNNRLQISHTSSDNKLLLMENMAVAYVFRTQERGQVTLGQSGQPAWMHHAVAHEQMESSSTFQSTF
jgi:hypothetical protein